MMVRMEVARPLLFGKKAVISIELQRERDAREKGSARGNDIAEERDSNNSLDNTTHGRADHVGDRTRHLLKPKGPTSVGGLYRWHAEQ